MARLAHQDPVSHATFSPNGRLLAVASGTNVFISPWRSADIVDYICAHLPFNLTPGEWNQYLPREPYRKTCPNLP